MFRLVIGLALLSAVACNKDNKTMATEPPAGSATAHGSAAAHAPATPATPSTPAGYPADFPLIDGGAIDPGYKPELMPGEVSDVLVAYPKAAVMPLAADLTAAAKAKGWSCRGDGATSPPIRLMCTKGSASVTVNIKEHPAGGVALFVSVP